MTVLKSSMVQGPIEYFRLEKAAMSINFSMTKGLTASFTKAILLFKLIQWKGLSY